LRNRFSLTKNELKLAVFIALLGFIFSSRPFIKYLALQSSPVIGFTIYYCVLFAITMVLAYLGFSVFNIQIKNVLQVIGTLMIVFSFFIVINWESQYVQYVDKGTVEGASNVFYSSEDGITFWVWHDIAGINDMNKVRILTFIITPFILTLLGGLLVTRAKINLL